MERWEARHRSLFLLFLLLSSLSAQSFTDCISPEKLDRFWEFPSYMAGNPYIYKLGFTDFYSFALDNATQTLGLENTTLAGWDSFRHRLPPGEEKEFGAAASQLSNASASLSLAKESAWRAHGLSLAAQQSVSHYLLSPENQLSLAMTLLFSTYSPAHLIFKAAEKVWQLREVVEYSQLYPQYYSTALSQSASAYDSVNLAALHVAHLAQREYSLLEKEGAGSSVYSGAAKEPYLRARSALSDASSFCARQSGHSDKIAEYFASRPATPDFSQVDFGGYLQNTGGAGGNSTISVLLSFYAELLGANERMEGEYQSAELEAQTSFDALTTLISSLDGEELQLIGDAPQFSGEANTLSVGSSFSGIATGLRQGKTEKEKAERLLSTARRSHTEKNADGYLAFGIMQAKEAGRVSAVAQSSLSGVRSSAQAAVEMEKAFAGQAISRAEQKLFSSGSTLSDANSLLAAKKSLDEAKKAFSSADFAYALGRKYAAYSLSAEKAAEAIAYSDNRISMVLSGAALQEISSLRRLLDSAQADGLEVSYEREQVSQLESLLRLAGPSSSEEMLSAVLTSIREERQAVLLRLSAKYSHLAPLYADVREKVLAIRGQAPAFLPEFDSLQLYFAPSGLDTQSAAGSLRSIGEKLLSLRSEADKRLPDYLESLLSDNAEAHELVSLPVLGRQTGYSSRITVSNPSGFSYSGPLSFSVRTNSPLYSSDFISGDSFSEIYPENGKTTITVPGIGAGQKLDFKFEKKEQPAQTISSQEACSLATSQEAQVRRKIGFFATRRLSLLGISEPAPDSSYGGRLSYLGATQQLRLSWLHEGSVLEGETGPVEQGQGSVEVSFSVSNPYAISQGVRSYETLQGGAKRITYLLTLDGVSVNCGSALVWFSEPFEVSGFSATAVSGEKISQPVASSSPGGSQMSFVLSPLSQGKTSSILVSYELSDAASSLSDALRQAEMQVLYYNRSRDVSSLEEARRLAAQNRTEEALNLLSKMRQESMQISASYADYQKFLSENASASSLLSSALAAQFSLSAQNLTAGAAQLSGLVSKLNEGMLQASSLAEDGKYPQAAASAAKAASEFRTSLASLAWKAATDASEEYAKARKAHAGALSDGLAAAQLQMNGAQSLFSQGDHFGSYENSQLALQSLAAASDSLLAEGEASSAQAEKINADFASLRAKTGDLLAKYSAQFSALSSQSKRQLPITPSDAQDRMDAAEKGMAAATKAKPQGAASLSQANSSYQQLLSASNLVEQSLLQLRSMADASLRVARLAASEAKQKSGGESEALQIADEVSRAENFYSNALYSDSLVSSERAISAANLLLSKSASGLDIKTVLLAAVSLAFILGAAYYLLGRGQGGGGKQGKKELPKAEEG